MTMNFNSRGAVGAVTAVDALGGVQPVKRREGSHASSDEHGGPGTTFSSAMRDARADTQSGEAGSETLRARDKARREDDKRASAKADDGAAQAAAPSLPTAEATRALPDPEGSGPASAGAGAVATDKPAAAADTPGTADLALAALRAGCGLPAPALPAGGTAAASGTPALPVAGTAASADGRPVPAAPDVAGAIGARTSPAAIAATGPDAHPDGPAVAPSPALLAASGESPLRQGGPGFQLPASAGAPSRSAGVADTRARPAPPAAKTLSATTANPFQPTTDLPAVATVQMAQTLTQTHDWATLQVEGIHLQAPSGAGQASTIDLAAAVQAGASMSLVQNQAPAETASPVTQAALAVPLDSPEFAGALARQVGYWINGGVQTAEIHLNPADMGPISVQMSLQGGDARVDFSAVSAQTRQVLQDSIPQLAQMLEQAGMSLLSADVSAQQGRSQQREAPRQSSPSGASRAGMQALDGLGSAAAVSAATLSRSRPGTPGRLDLYA